MQFGINNVSTHNFFQRLQIELSLWARMIYLLLLFQIALKIIPLDLGGGVTEWSACWSCNPVVLHVHVGLIPALTTRLISFTVAPSSNPLPHL